MDNEPYMVSKGGIWIKLFKGVFRYILYLKVELLGELLGKLIVKVNGQLFSIQLLKSNFLL